MDSGASRKRQIAMRRIILSACQNRKEDQNTEKKLFPTKTKSICTTPIRKAAARLAKLPGAIFPGLKISDTIIIAAYLIILFAINTEKRSLYIIKFVEIIRIKHFCRIGKEFFFKDFYFRKRGGS